MASQLPLIPRLTFTIFEPISLIAGSLPAIFFPQWFASQQTPFPHQPDPSSVLVTRQLGNMYLLAFLIGTAVLHTTSEVKVVRAYLWALWAADITHVWFTCAALGWEGSVRAGEWNGMTWGNVGATLALNMMRNAYFLGWFGDDLAADKDLKKGKKEL